MGREWRWRGGDIEKGRKREERDGGGVKIKRQDLDRKGGKDKGQR